MPEYRRAVYAITAPASIDHTVEVANHLSALYGKDLYMTNPTGLFVFWTPGKECPCRECDRKYQDMLSYMPELQGVLWAHSSGMIVCPDCGNKRCPQAENHDYVCTRSNDPDQEPEFKYWHRDTPQAPTDA